MDNSRQQEGQPVKLKDHFAAGQLSLSKSGILSQFNPFLLTCLLFCVAGGILLSLTGYKESFLILNRLHFPLGDRVMPHYTHLGDGILITAIFALFILKKDKGLIISLALSLIAVTISIGFLKSSIFPDWHRPPVIFAGLEEIHYITLENERHRSFPSGHSAAATAMIAFLGYYTSRFHKLWGVLFGILALALCYSRLYIGVHFLGDILAGSLLGLGLAALSLLYIYPKLYRWFGSISKRGEMISTVIIGLLAIGLIVFDIYRIWGHIYR